MQTSRPRWAGERPSESRPAPPRRPSRFHWLPEEPPARSSGLSRHPLAWEQPRGSCNLFTAIILTFCWNGNLQEVTLALARRLSITGLQLERIAPASCDSVKAASGMWRKGVATQGDSRLSRLSFFLSLTLHSLYACDRTLNRRAETHKDEGSYQVISFCVSINYQDGYPPTPMQRAKARRTRTLPWPPTEAAAATKRIEARSHATP